MQTNAVHDGNTVLYITPFGLNQNQDIPNISAIALLNRINYVETYFAPPSERI